MNQPGRPDAGPRPAPLALSVPEAAHLLNISRAHAYRMIARGELPALRLGRRKVIPRVALDRLLNQEPDDAVKY